MRTNFDFLLAGEKWERGGEHDGEALSPACTLSEFVIYERCRRRREFSTFITHQGSSVREPCPLITVRFLKVERAKRRGESA